MKISKNMARLITVLVIFMSIVMSLSMLYNGVYAAGMDLKNISAVSTDADSAVNKVVGMVLSIAQIIGVGVAVIMLIVLAIKYISAAPNDKAEIKKHAVVYIVGAIVLFAATGLLQIVKNFSSGIGK